MPVRGTPNYVWFTEQPLGSGATGKVYFGRHKRMGDVCAVKVFDDQVRSSRIRDKTRELELMKKLSHRNVVRLLAIEHESHTKQNVLIMELCSEGSVYDLLCQPENCYGFPELQFIEFFKDFVAGLEYLKEHDIIHRDIKPGNILCSKRDDGRLVYKLTDFESARKLEDGEQFMSMYGTEEYLHPDVYGRALLTTASSRVGAALPPRMMFDSSVDMWSMGATLYHVATGQVPFLPFGGRANRDTMHKMITEKPSGSIGAVQHENNGRIEYLKDFPETCLLSRGLRKYLLPIIAKSLEYNPQNQLTFDEFFAKARHLNSLKDYHVRCLESFTLHRLYLQNEATFSKLQQELHEQTNVSPADQLLIFNACLLNEIITAEEVTLRKFNTTENMPVALLRRVDGGHGNIKLRRTLPNIPAIPSDAGNDNANMDTDAVWARDACAFLIYLHNLLSDDIIESQKLLHVCQQTLCDSLFNRFKLVEIQFSDAKDLLQAIASSIELFGGYSASTSASSVQGNESGIGSLNTPDTGFDSGKGVSRSAGRPHDSGIDTASSFPPTAQSHHSELPRLHRLQKHILDQLVRFKQQDLQLEVCFQADCEKDRCEPKLKTLLDQAKRTHEQFKKDKTCTLSYNESQVHKYDKIKLDEVVRKKAVVHYERHCVNCAQKSVDNYKSWFREKFKKYSDDVQHMEKDLTKFRNMTKNLAESVKKMTPHKGIEDLPVNVDRLPHSSAEPAEDIISSITVSFDKLNKKNVLELQKTKVVLERNMMLIQEVKQLLDEREQNFWQSFVED